MATGAGGGGVAGRSLVALVQLLKQLFGRRKDGILAYPSGHTTVAVVIWGWSSWWPGRRCGSVVVAPRWCVLGMLGQGVTYHYFTDTVGGVLLGTAIVCAPRGAYARPNLTGVNPGAICVTREWLT